MLDETHWAGCSDSHSGGEVGSTGFERNAFSMPVRCQGVSETGHLQCRLRHLTLQLEGAKETFLQGQCWREKLMTRVSHDVFSQSLLVGQGRKISHQEIPPSWKHILARRQIRFPVSLCAVKRLNCFRILGIKKKKTLQTHLVQWINGLQPVMC